MAEKSERKIIGVFEPVSFPDFGMKNIVAKIDTGAYSGALHCTNIEESETPDGKVLRFSPFDKPNTKVTTREFIISHVKSSNGKIEKRYFITTTIVIDNNAYEIVLSLANRSEMRRPVLIGRRFLRRHNFVVDPANLGLKPPKISKGDKAFRVDATQTAQYRKRV